VVGCDVWERCPFALTKNGGFKGTTWRPREILYYLEPNDGTTHAKEDELPCYKYTRLLANKARDGRIDLEEGRAGEIIQIIGQEPCADAPKFDPKAMEADSTCPACGARHWYTENTLQNVGTPLTPKWENVPKVKTCSVYVHGQQIAGLKHERDIRAKARERMAADPEAASGPPRIKGNPNEAGIAIAPLEGELDA
jgi:hypothetical protein